MSDELLNSLGMRDQGFCLDPVFGRSSPEYTHGRTLSLTELKHDHVDDAFLLIKSAYDKGLMEIPCGEMTSNLLTNYVDQAYSEYEKVISENEKLDFTSGLFRHTVRSLPVRHSGVILSIVRNSTKRHIGIVIIDKIEWIDRTCSMQVSLLDSEAEDSWSDSLALIERYIFGVLNLNSFLLFTVNEYVSRYTKAGYEVVGILSQWLRLPDGAGKDVTFLQRSRAI